MKVTVGVTGGIAAYKAAELVRALQQQALDVHVVMTAAAQQFITPLTFAGITGHRVITGLWDSDGQVPNANSAIEHISEAQSTAGPNHRARDRRHPCPAGTRHGRRFPNHHGPGYTRAIDSCARHECADVGAPGHAGQS